MAAPKNITELRNDLLESFEEVKTNPKCLPQAAELANHAGKIMASVSLQITTAMLCGQQPEIPFIGTMSGKPLNSFGMKKLKKLKK